MKQSLLSAGLIAAGAAPALAHHPLGGLPMETFAHGALSGIGHPLLGFDHLLFVIGVGMVAVFTGHRYLAPAAYIGAMVIGCLISAAGIGVPIAEAAIALSLLAVGFIALRGLALALAPAAALFAVFGIFHGAAFGEAIAAQEAGAGTSVLIGYLLGLGIVQYGIALGAGYAITAFFKVREAMAIEARLAGAMVAGVGLFLSLEIAEGMVVAALGWAA
ncbi:MAG: HupE/UreJ family protein [Pseudomonadota bacterium]